MWIAGQVVGCVVLAGIAAVFGVLAWLVVASAGAPDRDRHGYVVIFGSIFLALLVVPLVLAGVAAVLLLLRRRAGFIVQAVLGAVLSLALMTLTFWGILIGLAGAGVTALALTGYVKTGEPGAAPPLGY